MMQSTARFHYNMYGFESFNSVHDHEEPDEISLDLEVASDNGPVFGGIPTKGTCLSATQEPMDLGPKKIDCESGHRILLGSYLGDLQVDLLLERPSKKMAPGRMVSWVDVFFWASQRLTFSMWMYLLKLGYIPPQKKHAP